MKKTVIIINGSGGAGKDTLCEIAGKYYRVMNVSSIDPIKKIALENGWNGDKTEKSRKFLADLKSLFVEYNDLPLCYLMEQYEVFKTGDDEIMFVHIREPKEIEKFKAALENHCKTLLVRGRKGARTEWNNASDDAVEEYDYDVYYENDKPLEEAEMDFIRFLNSVIGGKEEHYGKDQK